MIFDVHLTSFFAGKLANNRGQEYHKSTGKKRSWTDTMLAAAVAKNRSFRAVILELGLVPAGGNYAQVQARCQVLELDTTHFTGKGWSTVDPWRHVTPPKPLVTILTVNSRYLSFGLKKRLFAAGYKTPKCELCGWAQESKDGRIPVELDHINGDHYDNRLENLRILCPNCHGLQPTHQGINKRVVRIKQNRQNSARVL